MCGIAGIWGQADEGTVRTMMERVAHRGPDAQGLYAHPRGRGTLGHRRLSIVDPEGGDQPLFGPGDRVAIVANGEIYNAPRLREELAGQYPFRTGSDTEAIIALYADRGADSVLYLDGMYAFALADGDDLLVARDPIGIKPLYVGRRGEGICFASELKGLTGLAEDVREFPPGTAYHSTRGLWRFYDVPERSPEDMPVEVERRLRDSVEEAVRARLMSDVPVATFLSGGLDSSIIAALARRYVAELHSFSVGIEGSPDLDAARAVARHIGTIHHEYVFTRDEIIEKLPEIIYHLESYDQDLVRSAIPCYFTARLAAREVKVILTGEGADELFAGYRYYKDFKDPAALHQELRRSVKSLHNVNLQRLDRMTMAHGLEGRVPFLDVRMIALAQEIAPVLKLARDRHGRLVEKWVLRKAFEDLLPADIVWRRKEQFDEGSGTAAIVSRGLEEWLKPADAEAYRAQHTAARLRSAEEAAYHKILRSAFGDPEPILRNVGRWSDRPRPD